MPKILIVDDHAVVRRGVREILESEADLKVLGEAETGLQALELVKKEKWDLVLLDLNLPDLSGLEVLKQIRSQFPKLPILVLSMHPEDEFAIMLIRAGASGYLAKETAPEELVQAVRKVMAGGEYVSAVVAEKLVMGIKKGKVGMPHERLSDREFEVLLMIANGLAVSDIAKKMFLSVKTVSTYRSRILEKMEMKTNADLMRYAMTHNLISPDPLSDKNRQKK